MKLSLNFNVKKNNLDIYCIFALMYENSTVE